MSNDAIRSSFICAAIGAILASGGLSVANSWECWAVLILAAINGAGWWRSQ